MEVDTLLEVLLRVELFSRQVRPLGRHADVQHAGLHVSVILKVWVREVLGGVLKRDGMLERGGWGEEQ